MWKNVVTVLCLGIAVSGLIFGLSVIVYEVSPSSSTSTTLTARPYSAPSTTEINLENDTDILGNVTEDWVPTTTILQALLPSVTSVRNSPSTSKNQTSSSVTVPSFESLSTFIPTTPEIPFITSSRDIPITSMFPDSGSNFTLSPISAQNYTTTPESTTSSTSLVKSIVTTTSKGEKRITSTKLVPETNPVNMSDFTDDDVCGRSMWPEAKIVGGENSSFGKWPWQISLRKWKVSSYVHRCGAALLNENWAITAAHCVRNVPRMSLLLRLGEYDLSVETEPYPHEERRVYSMVSHPQYDFKTWKYDLALLQFNKPVQFQPNIVPVCMPTTEESFVGSMAFLTGWGVLSEDGAQPNILQEVLVPVLSNSVCESMIRSSTGFISYYIPRIFICAGWRSGGSDSCTGDSGGPLVVERKDKRFLLAGVISYGFGCGEPYQPGINIRISEVKDWINKIIKL